MATTRGFVEQIEVGRGGLVRVTVVNSSARNVFTVSDIDGDPERFNERLTKVSVCRDAMNRAEPLEVETEGNGKEIVRVARITRDDLLDGDTIELIGGLVLKIVVESSNALNGAAEVHDNAEVTLIDVSGSTVVAQLDLQAPERLVASDQLRLLTGAQESGSMVQLLVATTKEDTGDAPEIISVWLGEGTGGREGESQQVVVCGFVEALGTMLPPAAVAIAGSLALVRLTTSPELSGQGGTVDPDTFDPATIAFFVARGSVNYALMEAAVRENVRVRVRVMPLIGDGKHESVNEEVVIRTKLTAAEVADDNLAYVEAGASAEDLAEVTGLLLAGELQAPLSSASRPVWVHIDREMLDRGPDADCVAGVPSTTLHVRTLRDLRIPYPAEWIGHGCFNHGVYRFQLLAPHGSLIAVDGEPLCLFPAGDKEGVVVGYACLEGDHCVTVQIPEYMCNTEFDLDVYRVR